MQTTQLSGVQANVLRNQPYLLTTGTLIPCTLQTAMDSTLPGFVTCIIPQDIQGKTGLTLLDRGTKVVGQFQGGVKQGVERMFVMWTRAETPQGVVVNLDSPASDPLGRSGLSGAVDRHFFQRFGGALLMSVVDGALQAGQAAVSKSGTVTINTGSTSSVIGETVRGSSNIPPTVRKNQGELVSIFVARDVDFSTVYQVTPAQPRYVGGR
jgi:type IV secretion system protein VirB10